LHILVNTIASIQNPGNGGNAYVGGRCDFAEARLAIANTERFLAHLSTMPLFRGNRIRFSVSLTRSGTFVRLAMANIGLSQCRENL
jgi:hypothetical protein